MLLCAATCWSAVELGGGGVAPAADARAAVPPPCRPMYVPVDAATAAGTAIALTASRPWRLVQLGLVNPPDASGQSCGKPAAPLGERHNHSQIRSSCTRAR